MKPPERKIQRSALKYLIIFSPLVLFMVLLCIYGQFLLKIIPFTNPMKPKRPPKHILFNSSRFLIGNFSLRNRNDFFVKMQVIRDKNAKLPDQRDCGIVNRFDSKRRTRIVRGNEAAPNSFPWMASLKHFRNNVVQEHFCAGSLIYEKYILTAAHCLTGLTKHDFVVVLGKLILGVRKAKSVIKYFNLKKKGCIF